MPIPSFIERNLLLTLLSKHILDGVYLPTIVWVYLETDNQEQKPLLHRDAKRENLYENGRLCLTTIEKIWCSLILSTLHRAYCMSDANLTYWMPRRCIHLICGGEGTARYRRVLKYLLLSVQWPGLPDIKDDSFEKFKHEGWEGGLNSRRGRPLISEVQSLRHSWHLWPLASCELVKHLVQPNLNCPPIFQ